MAENEAAVQDQNVSAEQGATEVDESEKINYQIKIEEAGSATKKVSIEIPAETIASKLEEQFKQIRREAAIPGFRPGHAPQKLIEKRFNHDVREQVRRSLISESYEQAVKEHSLEVIGEPEFDKPDEIKLPETGSLTYTFQVEVQPSFELPPLEGLKVKRPKVEVADTHVDQALLNLREQRGAVVPVEDRGVETGDYLIADVHIKVDGNVVSHQHDAQLRARAGRVGGIDISDFDARVAGLKPGESREFTVKVPDDNPDEKIRGKEVVVDIALKDIKKMELAEVNQEFLDSLGFATEPELREELRNQMLQRVEYDVQQTMRQQVNNYLIGNVKMELPSKLSDRQAERVVQRRKLELIMRGVPEEKVNANADVLATGAKDEAMLELKLFFILQKIADQQKVDVTEGELNNRIAMIAGQSGRRPETVKQDMAADGSLRNLYVQMREQKAVDRILATAQIEDVVPPAASPEAPKSDSTVPGGEAKSEPEPAREATGSEPA